MGMTCPRIPTQEVSFQVIKIPMDQKGQAKRKNKTKGFKNQSYSILHALGWFLVLAHVPKIKS